MSYQAQEPTTISLTNIVVNGPRLPPSPSTHIISDSPLALAPLLNYPTPKRPAVQREHTIDPLKTPATIPPHHPQKNRTLVLCFDGTGDQFDADNSNIVQLVGMLKKDDKNKQMVYYQSGIGTYTTPQLVTPIMSSLSKILDEMIAWNLDAHVMHGYEFLMQNFVTGDKICIFGFSRGAYTARSLAGMIHKIGLLPADNHQQVPFAYKMYTRVDKVGWDQSNEFKKAFCVEVSIEFIGVWDTVDSVGIIPKRLPFTTSNTIVRTFRHAVSLDERRAKFKTNLWNNPTEEEARLGLPSKAGTSGYTAAVPSAPPLMPVIDEKTSVDWEVSEMEVLNGDKNTGRIDKKKARRMSSGIEDKDEKILSKFERQYSEKSKKTDIDEVWFAGCHCDVGGGSVRNKTRHSLARISLRWMIRECFKTKTGIMFDSASLFTIGLDPSTLYPFVTPRPPPLAVSQKVKFPADISMPSNLQRCPEVAAIIPDTSQSNASKEVEKVSFRVSEEQEELWDALAPMHDQLVRKKLWWILEVLPLKLKYQSPHKKLVEHFRSNMARPRIIPSQEKGIRVHRSVRTRMEAEFEEGNKKRKRYIPKPKFIVEPTWID